MAALASASCRCTESHDALASTKADLQQLFDRAPDRAIELGEGNDLLVWEFHQDWSELGPSHYYYFGIGERQSSVRSLFLGECVPFGRWVSAESPRMFLEREYVGLSMHDIATVLGEHTSPEQRMEVVKKIGWKHD